LLTPHSDPKVIDDPPETLLIAVSGLVLPVPGLAVFFCCLLMERDTDEGARETEDMTLPERTVDDPNCDLVAPPSFISCFTCGPRRDEGMVS